MSNFQSKSCPCGKSPAVRSKSMLERESCEVAIDDDPATGAFLSLLAKDIETHPDRITPLSASRIARAAELTAQIGSLATSLSKAGTTPCLAPAERADNSGELLRALAR
jgi:hypothetical protein